MPDIVLNRTRDCAVSQFYERRGVNVYNSAHLTYIGNNKYEAIKYLSTHLAYDVLDKKWTANTQLLKSTDLAKILESEYINTITSNLTHFGNDTVIKSVDGHGGAEVFLLEGNASFDKRREIVQKLLGHDCVVQERIDSTSSDIRVYIVGGEIYAAMMRTGKDSFRSNYSLGGSAKEYRLDNAQKSYVMKFVDALGGSRIGMIGIDYIFTKDGELIFNEVEEMVGSRMLYEHTDYDIVKDYVQWILKIKKGVLR